MRCVALLRGVNVGKAKRVPMAEWAQLLEAQGFTQVRTLLNSGNAVFTYNARSKPASLAANIRTQLLEALKVDVPVVVKTAGEMETIMNAMPWRDAMQSGAADPSRLLVSYAQTPDALAALSVIAEAAGPDDHWHLAPEAGYLWCPQGILESPAGAALLGKVGRQVTTRNWATTLKLQACLAAAV